jgi:hypothetical protein
MSSLDQRSEKSRCRSRDDVSTHFRTNFSFGASRDTPESVCFVLNGMFFARLETPGVTRHAI